MSRYPLVPLSELLESSIDEVVVEPEAIYPIAGVYSFGRGLFARTPIVGADTKYTKLHRLHADQLVMSRLKAWEGAVAVVQPEFEGMYVSQEFPTFSVREGHAGPGFVSLIARWPAFWESLLGHSRGIGARRERVHSDRLLATEVPLPPLDEQARIVERMGRVALVRARADASRGLASALGQSTLGGALGESSGHPLVPLGRLLEPSIDEVVVEPEATYPIAGVYSFGRGLFAKPSLIGADTTYRKLHRLHAGQFVYSRLFAWEGALAMVSTEFNGYHASPEFPTFTVRADAASGEFIGWLTRWPELWDALRDKTTGLGLRRQRVPVDRLLTARVPLPPLDEQARIVERMGRVALVRARADERAAKLVVLEQATLTDSLGFGARP